MRLAIVLAAVLAMAGCSYLSKGSGEDALEVHNLSGAPRSVILRITTFPGDIPVFSEEVFLDTGQSLPFAVPFAPGPYQAAITTTGMSELIGFTVPEKGHVTVSIDVFRGGASIRVNEAR